jgi:hypothetical protein
VAPAVGRQSALPAALGPRFSCWSRVAVCLPVVARVHHCGRRRRLPPCDDDLVEVVYIIGRLPDPARWLSVVRLSVCVCCVRARARDRAVKQWRRPRRDNSPDISRDRRRFYVVVNRHTDLLVFLDAAVVVVAAAAAASADATVAAAV